MIKGKFNIEDYQVTISGNTETRQSVIFYDIDGEPIWKARYSGNIEDIPEGYVNLNNCPARVMRWQFRAQLATMPSPDINYNSLEEYITYLITQMTGEEKTYTEKAWNEANTISRYSPTIQNFGTILSLSSAEIDDIFINADQITI